MCFGFSDGAIEETDVVVLASSPDAGWPLEVSVESKVGECGSESGADTALPSSSLQAGEV